MIFLADKVYQLKLDNKGQFKLIVDPVGRDILKYFKTPICDYFLNKNNVLTIMDRERHCHGNIEDVTDMVCYFPNIWIITKNSELKCISDSLITETFSMPIIAVSCGTCHIVILDDNHHVWSRGDNEYGQLGLQDPQHLNTFTKLNMNDIVAISCYGFSTMILDSNKCAYVCGDNSDGQCGIANCQKQFGFLAINVPEVSKIYTGFRSNYLINSHGFLYISGFVLGSYHKDSFKEIDFLSEIIDLYVDLIGVLLLDSQGKIYFNSFIDDAKYFKEFAELGQLDNFQIPCARDKKIKSATSDIF